MNVAELAADPDFQQAERRLRWRQSLIGCVLTVILVPTGIGLDLAIYREHFLALGIIRGICTLAMLAALVAHFVPGALGWIRSLSFAWVLAPSLAIAAMIAVTEGSASPYYAGLMIVITGVCTLFPWSWREALTMCVLVVGGYLIACLVHPAHGAPWGLLATNLMFLGMTAAICVTGCHSARRRRLEDYRLRHELDRRKHEIEDSYQQLAELDRLKSEFFANVSHELRTPLTLIAGPLSELSVRGEELPAEVGKAVDMAHANALRLLKLINDLLETVRLEAGAIQMQPQPIAADEFYRAQVESMRYLAEAKGLAFDVDSELGDAVIEADPSRLEKVVLNLLSNAIKFTPTGGAVTVILRRQDGSVLCEVCDTGIGIPPGEIERVFDRFRQVSGGSDRRYQGAGIGLSLARELAREMGGEIVASSVAGEGTMMRLSLPESAVAIAQARSWRPRAAATEDRIGAIYQAAERGAGSLAVTAGAGAAVAEDSGAGDDRILVIDDEPDMRRYLVDHLARHHRVFAAEDGERGLALAAEHRPGLAVVDMMLPGLDGIEVVKRLRADERHQDLRIVMLTARGDDATRHRALAAGVDDFLTKPFSILEVTTRVANLLRSHRLQRDLRTRAVELEEALAQLRATESQLVHSEKVRALGDMAAGLLHEINNPLNFTMTALAIARETPSEDAEDLAEMHADMAQGLERIKAIISDLRSFAYPTSAESQGEVVVADVIEAALRLTRHLVSEVELVRDIDPRASVLGSRDQLIHVIMNLVSNAVKAVTDADRPTAEPRVTITVHRRSEPDAVEISVRDNGVGIPPEDQQRIFTPFFTTRAPSAGMGLGLSLTQTLVGHHGGDIAVTSRPGAGTCFTITLPSVPAKVAS